MTPEVKFTVPEFVEVCNQTLEYSFTGIIVVGEVSSFKVNQGKWVFFDLKEGDVSVGCFMALSQLTVAVQDGMKIEVRATPRLTRWGKFSLTVQRIRPVGEGSIKKNFELLKRKLTAEGLFDPAKKRPLPSGLTKIGVISSVNAAGYLDFLKILDNRWGGLHISTVNTQVQGISAPEQIIRALDYFNQRANVEVIAILRGGGSADDFSAFNDEALVRAIAASRIPVITGIGHEIDESLADLAADVRASTPSNAAERLSPDRRAVANQINLQLRRARHQFLTTIDSQLQIIGHHRSEIKQEILHHLDSRLQHVRESRRLLDSLSPEQTLRRGYAIITGKLSPGASITITTKDQTLTAEVTHVQNREN